MRFCRPIIFLFNLLLLHSFQANAQDQAKIDSLLKVLPTLSEDTGKVMTLYRLGWEVSYKSLTEGLKYSYQAADLAQKLHFEFGLSRAYHDLGSIYLDMGDFEKANEYLYKELRILENSKNTHTLASCYVELGILYLDQKNLEKALHFDTLALHLYEKANNVEAIIACNLNLASDYEKLGNYSKALELNTRNLELAQHGGKKEQLASSYANIGALQVLLKNYKEGLKNLMTGYSLYKKGGYTYSLPQVLGSIGGYYMEIGDPRRAIAYFDTSLALIRQTGQKQMQINTYGNLSECYSMLGDYRQAYKYHKLFSSLKDSIFSDQKAKEITQNEMRYEFDKVQQEEKLKREQKEALDQLEIKRERLLIYVFMAGFLVLLVIAFIVYRGYKEKKKVNRELAHKNELIEEKNKSITDSITYAKRIQDAMLPAGKTVSSLLPSSFILFMPKDIVSGDFYWMERSGKKIVFTAVDCTGHGVPGAMVSVVGHNNLNRCLKEFRLDEPAAILDKLNELVQETFEKGSNEMRDGMDLALCSLDPESMVLEYAGANNPLWLCREENGARIITEVKADKQPIGRYAATRSFVNHRIPLKKGDSIYIFSDGYADQFGGEKGKKYKLRNLEKRILEIQDSSMEEQKKILREDFERWKGDLEQVDDVLIIGVRI